MLINGCDFVVDLNQCERCSSWGPVECWKLLESVLPDILPGLFFKHIYLYPPSVDEVLVFDQLCL